MLAILWMLHLFVFFYEWRKKSLSMVLWAMLFVVFTLPHTVHVFVGDFSQYILDQVSIFAILFMITYLILRITFFYNAENTEVSIQEDDINQTPNQLLNLFYTIYIISFIIVAVGFYARGYTLTSATWTQTLHRNTTLIEQLASKILICFSGLGFICFCKKQRFRFIILCAIYVFYLLLTKSRYNILGFIMPFIIYFLFNKRRKKVYLGVCAGIALVFFVFLFQQIRWLGGVSQIKDVGIFTLMDRSIDYMKAGEGELGLIKAFYYFVGKNNELQGFGEGSGFIRVALIFIPSAIMSFKPRDFAIDMYREWFHVDNPTGTMHPTLFGDAYANLGFAGWITGSLYALLVCMTDEIVSKEDEAMISVMKISLICTMFVLLGRGAIYNSIFNFLMGWILVEITFFSYKAYARRRIKK